MRLDLLGTLFFAGVRPGTSFLVFRGHDLVRNSAAQLRPTLTYAASSSDASFEPDQSSATGAADEALSGALTALGDSDVRLAQELLGSAMEGYRAVGLVDERAPLVAMVTNTEKHLVISIFFLYAIEVVLHARNRYNVSLNQDTLTCAL